LYVYYIYKGFSNINNKLNMFDVFYSLVNANQRFDRLVFDSLFIRHLNFVVKPLLKHHSSSVDHQVLDKICSKMLSWIHHKINKITGEPLSMECVLSTAHKPQLHSLSLVHFLGETFTTFNRFICEFDLIWWITSVFFYI
jgi:hypothetical protein